MSRPATIALLGALALATVSLVSEPVAAMPVQSLAAPGSEADAGAPHIEQVRFRGGGFRRGGFGRRGFGRGGFGRRGFGFRRGFGYRGRGYGYGRGIPGHPIRRILRAL